MIVIDPVTGNHAYPIEYSPVLHTLLASYLQRTIIGDPLHQQMVQVAWKRTQSI